MKKITKVLTLDSYITERVDVHQNALLGDYDKAGKYYINENIVEELLKMKKIKKSTYNNSMFCVSNNLGIGELVFEVHYNKKVNNGIASAEIFLLENIYKVNGYYSNTLKTSLGRFEESVQGFIDKSYKFFNISLIDEDDGREEVVDLNDLPYPYILAKKQYENTIFRNMEDHIYEAYEDFYQKKLEVLKEQNTSFADGVIKQYEEELKDARARFLTTDQDNNAKAVNELLDKAVEIKVDDPVTTKENVQDYIEEIGKSTTKLAQEYEEAKENGQRKVKKQMPKREYEYVVKMQDDLEKHNEEINEDKLSKAGFDFLEIEIVPLKEEKSKTKEEKPITKEMSENEKKKEEIAVLGTKKKEDEKGITQEKTDSVEKKLEAKDIISKIKADILMDQARERKEKELADKDKDSPTIQPTSNMPVEDKTIITSQVVEPENTDNTIPSEFVEEKVDETPEIVTDLADGFVAQTISEEFSNIQDNSIPENFSTSDQASNNVEYVDLSIEGGRLKETKAEGRSNFDDLKEMGDRNM